MTVEYDEKFEEVIIPFGDYEDIDEEDVLKAFLYGHKESQPDLQELYQRTTDEIDS